MRPNDEKLITGFARAGIIIEMNALLQHCDLVASMMDNEQTKLEEEFRKAAACESNLDNSDYTDHLSDEHWMIHTVLPRLQWQSQFLTVYATIEHILNEICEIVRRKTNSKLSFKDLDGSGIHRARNYLVKIGGIEEPFQTEKWQRIKLLGEIRNIIAHRRGEIDIINNTNLSNRLQAEEHLELRKLHEESFEAEIIFNHKFIKEAIRDSSSFISSITNFKLSPPQQAT
ncbi:hypothetical protein [Pseudomonas azotoformans]|uniref:hypothetical protein n=1 Tax=Pseudomonas azotoformans TaxID=47878 RepID=UPI000990247D|nr:hypothetical protein [Pseudomonas azotoformans]AQT94922.1 hypothetical protein B1R45_17150 [Pseudomonas azotoformans]UMY47031.1 hypothetical protein MLC69_17085 [Pseudomonas azotoformans]